MKNEKYWEMALDKTRISIKENSLFPLKTQDITKDIYGKNDFLIRRLDTTKFESFVGFWMLLVYN